MVVLLEDAAHRRRQRAERVVRGHVQGVVPQARPVDADVAPERAADDVEEKLSAAFTGKELSRPVYDQASGVLLDAQLVRDARAEELGYVEKHGVWELVPRAQALAKRKRVVGTKWVDLNKEQYRWLL